MNKFFLATLVMFAVCSSCLAATQVRVSDLDVDEFYRTYNNIAANANKNNFSFNEFPTKAMSNEIYDTYVATCGSHGHAIAVGLFANKEGQVSKITLSFDGNDELSNTSSANVFIIVLATLGMSKQEATALLQDMREKNPVNHFCAASKRFIVVDFSEDNTSGVVNIRLTAAVN